METKKFLDGEGLKTLWSEIASLQSDYNETDETSPNYIKNKPFTIDVIPEEVIEEFTFTTSDTIDNSTGLPTMQYVQLFNDLTIGQKMNLQFTYPELAAATGQPQYDDNGNIITKTVQYEDIEVGNFADAMGSQFLDSPAIMMGPGALIATLPESVQRVAIPNDDIVFVYSNATLANGAKTPLLIAALMDWSTGGYSTYIVNCSIATFTPKEVIFEASEDVCNSFQGDWTEGDNTKITYIKNKPFGEEVIPTPIGEIYEDSFIEKYGSSDLNGSEFFMGVLDHSLGTEIGQQYEVQYFISEEGVATINFSCVDNTVVDNIPDGVHFLGELNDEGQLQSIFLMMDNATYQDNDITDMWNVVYSPDNAVVLWLSDISKINIKNLNKQGLYDRVKLTKIPQKYLNISIDQSFDKLSENPQSGIAVQEAVQSQMPSINAPTTLGDGHLVYNVEQNGDALIYNLYTIGIGQTSNLKTSNKINLVSAINEVAQEVDTLNGSNLNSIEGKIKTAIQNGSHASHLDSFTTGFVQSKELYNEREIHSAPLFNEVFGAYHHLNTTNWNVVSDSEGFSYLASGNILLNSLTDPNNFDQNWNYIITLSSDLEAKITVRSGTHTTNYNQEWSNHIDLSNMPSGTVSAGIRIRRKDKQSLTLDDVVDIVSNKLCVYHKTNSLMAFKNKFTTYQINYNLFDENAVELESENEFSRIKKITIPLQGNERFMCITAKPDIPLTMNGAPYNFPMTVISNQKVYYEDGTIESPNTHSNVVSYNTRTDNANPRFGRKFEIPEKIMSTISEDDEIISNIIKPIKIELSYQDKKPTIADGQEFMSEIMVYSDWNNSPLEETINNYPYKKYGLGTAFTGDQVYVEWQQVAETYNPEGEQPTSGKAVADALSTIQMPIVDIDYNQDSENAQSGIAVASAIKDFVTQTDIDNSITNFVIQEDIQDFVTQDSFNTTIENFVTEDTFNSRLGDIESILDNIIATQNALIGGAEE